MYKCDIYIYIYIRLRVQFFKIAWKSEIEKYKYILSAEFMFCLKNNVFDSPIKLNILIYFNVTLDFKLYSYQRRYL